MRMFARFLGFVFATATIVFLIGADRRVRADLLFFEGSAGHGATARLRAASDDTVARRRRIDPRRIFARAAPVPAERRHSATGQAGVHLRRGQEFLQPRRASIRKASMRAVTVLAQGGRHVQGASTITQQVAKNFLVGNERSIERKIREALVSFRIEAAYSKEQDSRALSQRDLSRPRQLWRRRRGAQLFQQVGQ